MAIDFPSGDPNIPDAALAGETLATMHAGAGHPAATNRLIANIKALGAKLGYGAGNGVAGTLLRASAAGVSGWSKVLAGDYGPGSIVNADISATAGITKAKLAALGIVDADVASGAAIGLAKLFHVGTGNVLKSDGTGNVGGKVTSADIQDGTIVSADISATAAIVKSQLAALGIVDADVATAAAIAIAKLAHVGAGNVLRSNGTSNVAGQIVTGDIADSQITSAKIADNTIANADIAPQTIRGGVDGATSRIVPASLTNADLAAQTIQGGAYGAASRIVQNSINSQDIQDGGILYADIGAGQIGTVHYGDVTINNAKIAAQTIRGGYDGAASRITPGSLGTVDFMGGAAGRAIAAIDGAAASVTTPGGFVYAGISTGLSGLVPGRSRVLAMFLMAIQSNTFNAICQMGIGVDNASSPTIATTFTTPAANAVCFLSPALIHTATAGGHNYYGLWYTNAGTMNRYGTGTVFLMVINE